MSTPAESLPPTILHDPIASIPRVKSQAGLVRRLGFGNTFGPLLVVVGVIAFISFATNLFMGGKTPGVFATPVPSSVAKSPASAIIAFTPSPPARPAATHASEAGGGASGAARGTPVPSAWSYCATWVNEFMTVTDCGSVVNPSTLLR